jgi:hypothetical protein
MAKADGQDLYIKQVKSRLGTPTNSRPSSRADKKIRFAEVAAQNVHVYESAPSSPKKKPLALMSPTDVEPSDIPIVSLGTYKGPLLSQPTSGDSGKSDAEEGTPEDIRHRFFPSAPAFDPSLEWIRPPKPAGVSLRPLQYLPYGSTSTGDQYPWN